MQYNNFLKMHVPLNPSRPTTLTPQIISFSKLIQPIEKTQPQSIQFQNYQSNNFTQFKDNFITQNKDNLYVPHYNKKQGIIAQSMIVNINNNEDENNTLHSLNSLYRNKRFGVEMEYKKNLEQLKSANKIKINDQKTHEEDKRRLTFYKKIRSPQPKNINKDSKSINTVQLNSKFMQFGGEITQATIHSAQGSISSSKKNLMAPQKTLHLGQNNMNLLQVNGSLIHDSSLNSVNVSAVNSYSNSLTSSGNISPLVQKINPSIQQPNTGNLMKNKDPIPSQTDVIEKLGMNQNNLSPKTPSKTFEFPQRTNFANRKYSEDEKEKNVKKQDEKSTNNSEKNSINSKIPKFLQKTAQQCSANKQPIPNTLLLNDKLCQKQFTVQTLSTQRSSDLEIPCKYLTVDPKTSSTLDHSKQYNSHNIVKPSNMFSKKKTFEFNSYSFAKTSNTPQNLPTKLDYPNFQFGRLSSPSSFNNRKRMETIHQKKQFKLNDFQLINKLGKGAFGDVYMAKQITLGFICVLKKVSKKKIKQQRLQENILRQIKIQSYLKHKHLTEIFGYFDDSEYLYLILELLPDGSLNYSKKKKKVPQIQTSKYIRQVCEGLRYMHKEDIIHRDLKPQNIFLNQDYLKIGDFGCAVFTKTLRRTMVGCLAYISPQQLNNELYDDKIDVWCIGILTYELITGRAPFEADLALLSKQQKQFKLSQLKFPEQMQISEICKNFIKRLLQTNPTDRMTIQQSMKHPFIAKTFEQQRKDEQQIYGAYQSFT